MIYNISNKRAGGIKMDIHQGYAEKGIKVHAGPVFVQGVKDMIHCDKRLHSLFTAEPILHTRGIFSWN
jgi:hypothetical protein